MKTVSEMKKTMFGENYYMQSYNFYMTVICKQLLEKFQLEFQHVFNFSCTWNKEASSCQKNIAMFQYNIACMVNSFLFSLEIPVIISILYEIIKVMYEKVVNAIYSYCFHNNSSEKNNLLNGHSNKPWIN